MNVGTALGRWPGLAALLRVERILILGVTPLAEQVVEEIARRPGRRAVVGIIEDLSPRLDASARLSRLDALIDERSPHRILIALGERRGRTPMRTLLNSRMSRGVIVEDVAEYYERLTGKLALESLTPMSVICSGRFRTPLCQQALARTFSLLAALTALIVLSPVLALIAAAIKLDSKGPVFFAQARVGAGGRPFTLVKFRTMAHGRVKRSEWEGDNRDAVTRVGKCLRAFRLDELPQFVNILRGEMNLVGPRPHPVSNFELFTLVARNLDEFSGAAISCYELRTLVRPGLTGWAQVRYRYANNLEEEIEKLRYDLYYVKHISLWLDLRILLETVKVLRGQRPARERVTMPKRSRLRAVDASRSPFTLLGLVLMLVAPARSAAQPPRPAAQHPQMADASTRESSTREARPREYIIGPDDELEIAVWNNEAVTRTVPVRPDGRISLPLLNDVQAAGLTPMQLQGALAKALADFIQHPEVSVIVRAVHSFKVSVIGEVKEPGRFELTGHTTVLDVLALAKGLNEYADKKRIVVLRHDKGVTRPIPFAYDRLLSDTTESGGYENFFVQPDDIILVR